MFIQKNSRRWKHAVLYGDNKTTDVTNWHVKSELTVSSSYVLTKNKTRAELRLSAFTCVSEVCAVLYVFYFHNIFVCCLPTHNAINTEQMQAPVARSEKHLKKPQLCVRVRACTCVYMSELPTTATNTYLVCNAKKWQVQCRQTTTILSSQFQLFLTKCICSWNTFVCSSNTEHQTITGFVC